tara:strand:+ start:291 stop:473 length:183 start_codon:yes stop_codon:yes gene_type:complete
MVLGAIGMASSTAIHISLTNGMTTQEKIAAAKKRIKELELLIDLWFKDYANWKDEKPIQN